MFPPKKAKSVTEWLEHVLSSLGRGGLEFSTNIELTEAPEGKHNVGIRLLSPIPENGWEYFRDYLLQYSLAEGWKVEQLRRKKGYLTMRVSRA